MLKMLVALVSCLKAFAVYVSTAFALFSFIIFPHPPPQYQYAGELSSIQSLASCLTQRGVLNFTTSSLDETAYASLLSFSAQNLRFLEAGVPKPSALILPESIDQVQSALNCSLEGNEWALRVRGGGHSYEGLSFTADTPFVVIDLMNMNGVEVDMDSKTAWVEGGATLGEVYYAISEATSTYGFPAGTCPTVGVGGHISGGGFGSLARKYGLAADNVVDAMFVDAGGRLLNRNSMGEDIFWALRGGGGGSWGIVVAWQIKLVEVPSKVTSFSTWRIGTENVTELIYRWQFVAPTAPDELFNMVRMLGQTSSSCNSTDTNIAAHFFGTYFGNLTQTVTIFDQIFPELGITAADCKEHSWIESVANDAPVADPVDLQNRLNLDKNYFKAKSDFVTNPIPVAGLAGAFEFLQQNVNAWMQFDAYGGAMDRIKSDAIAFPHREGNLFSIQYQAVWEEEDSSEETAMIAWLRSLYDYMGDFVSKFPVRAAYINYLDLDVGDGTIAAQHYFLHNLPRLSQIKRLVDPRNIFNHSQSIPLELFGNVLETFTL